MFWCQVAIEAVLGLPTEWLPLSVSIILGVSRQSRKHALYLWNPSKFGIQASMESTKKRTIVLQLCFCEHGSTRLVTEQATESDGPQPNEPRPPGPMHYIKPIGKEL